MKYRRALFGCLAAIVILYGLVLFFAFQGCPA